MLFIVFFYDGKRAGERDAESIGFRRQIARFDLPGIITFVSATIALLLALSWGGTTYPWSDKRIIALLVLAGVLFCSFIGVERWRKDSAIIPLRLLRRRSMTAAIVFGICLGGVFFVSHVDTSFKPHLTDPEHHCHRSMFTTFVSLESGFWTMHTNRRLSTMVPAC